MIFVIKKKGQILIQDIPEENEDSYSRAKITQRHLIGYGIRHIPCVITQQDDRYDDLKFYIDICNVMNSSQVPNKRVVSDVVTGTSKLNRHQEKGFIELTKRYIRKDGTCNLEVTTPNVCFITDNQKWEFFKDLRNHGETLSGKGSNRRVITSDSSVYDYWSRLMDKEYSRLSGINFLNRKKETEMLYHGDQHDRWWKLIGDIGKQIFQPLELTAEVDILSDLWNEHNQVRKFYTIYQHPRNSVIFDRDGRFVDLVENFRKRSLFEILKKLNIEELEIFLQATKMCILKHKYN